MFSYLWGTALSHFSASVTDHPVCRHEDGQGELEQAYTTATLQHSCITFNPHTFNTSFHCLTRENGFCTAMPTKNTMYCL